MEIGTGEELELALVMILLFWGVDALRLVNAEET
jgi:hypothetical protein